MTKELPLQQLSIETAEKRALSQAASNTSDKASPSQNVSLPLRNEYHIETSTFVESFTGLKVSEKKSNANDILLTSMLLAENNMHRTTLAQLRYLNCTGFVIGRGNFNIGDGIIHSNHENLQERKCRYNNGIIKNH